MTLEDSIRQYLMVQESLTSKLAIFNSHPSIFYQQAPDDKDPGWGSRLQYPRIKYMLTMQSNAERKSAGILQFTILSEHTGTLPEEIEPLLKQSLKDVLISTEDHTTYTTTWARTEAFSAQQYKDDIDNKVLGLDLFFDVLEFPFQETMDPDPVVALNRYVKKEFPDAVIIGLDKTKEYLKPSIENPVIYCRLSGLEKDRVTNTVAWMKCKISIHVLSSDSNQRLKIITCLTNQLSLEEEVIMLDESPMGIQSLQMDNTADYLTQGQIEVTGKYGILKCFTKGKKARIKLIEN